MDPSVDMEAGGQGHSLSAVYFKVSRGIVGRDKFAYFQWFWPHLTITHFNRCECDERVDV